jgi:hypothetical protein
MSWESKSVVDEQTGEKKKMEKDEARRRKKPPYEISR